jgi:hypothetical protein
MSPQHSRALAVDHAEQAASHQKPRAGSGGEAPFSGPWEKAFANYLYFIN